MLVDGVLLINSVDLAACGEESRGVTDGLSHRAAPWQFPDALPCAWRLTDDCDDARAVRGDSTAALRRAALAALGCCAARVAGCDDDARRLGYLRSKAAVDARSRNGFVLAQLGDELRIKLAGSRACRVVDFGAGALSMVPVIAAVLERAGVERATYVAIDADSQLLRRGLEAMTERFGPELRVGTVSYAIECVAQDALAFRDAEGFDLIVANAFCDLAPPSQVMEAVRRVARRDGALAYLPITFDGRTWLEPALVERGGRGVCDEEAFAAYGSHLKELEGQHVDVDALKLAALTQGCEVLLDAKSDWRLRLGDADDARFARFLADFIGAAVAPAFFGDRDAATAAVSWTRALRAECGDEASASVSRRALCAANRDLLLRVPPS